MIKLNLLDRKKSCVVSYNNVKNVSILPLALSITRWWNFKQNHNSQFREKKNRKIETRILPPMEGNVDIT